MFYSWFRARSGESEIDIEIPERHEWMTLTKEDKGGTKKVRTRRRRRRGLLRVRMTYSILADGKTQEGDVDTS